MTKMIKNMRRQFLSLSLILAIAFSAIAQQRTDEAAPSVERLRAHISYLASDKLEGRSTGRAGADLAEDRIAIAFEGTPDGDNPHGHFAQYTDVRWKAIAAREHGAKALAVIAREENFKDDSLSQLRYDNSAGDAALPVVVISRQAAQRIFEAGGLRPVAETEKATQAIVTTLAQPSATEKRKNASLPLQNVTLNITTDITRRSVPAYNVVGILDGSDPVLKNEVIDIGAHYDHLGRGGEGSLAPRAGDIHHGADDNASGVAG